LGTRSMITHPLIRKPWTNILSLVHDLSQTRFSFVMDHMTHDDHHVLQWILNFNSVKHVDCGEEWRHLEILYLFEACFIICSKLKSLLEHELGAYHTLIIHNKSQNP
jgi:hypothetical protein